MRNLILAAALLAFTTPALAETPDPNEWLPIMTTDKGTGIYARVDDLLAGGPSSRKARVWVLADASKVTGEDYKMQLGMQWINCVEETYSIEQLTTYYRDGHTKTDSGVQKWLHIMPDSMISGIAELVCMDKSKLGQ